MSDSLSVPENASYVICGARLSRCECVLPLGHFPETPHACDEGCGGSWTYDAEGEPEIVSYPSGVGTGRRNSGESIPFLGPFADPILAMLLAGGPIRVQRGGIRYLTPPRLTGQIEAPE